MQVTVDFVFRIDVKTDSPVEAHNKAERELSEKQGKLIEVLKELGWEHRMTQIAGVRE